MPQYINYKILKVFNNNVLLTQNLCTGKEQIIVGKGIGFAQKTGKVICLFKSQIEKSFIPYDCDVKNEFYELLKQLDGEVLVVSEEIISLATERFGELNNHVHIALTDHISFSIDRLKMNMQLNNPFLNEIKLLYSEEYEVAEMGSKLVEEKLKVQLPDSELGFIALHIHAARQNKKVSETVRYTKLISQLVKMVESNLEIHLERTELSYIRLVNHLRFTIDRIQKGIIVNNPIIESIGNEFSESFEIAKKIGNHIELKLDECVSNEELSYITIHIRRLKDLYGNK